MFPLPEKNAPTQLHSTFSERFTCLSEAGIDRKTSGSWLESYHSNNTNVGNKERHFDGCLPVSNDFASGLRTFYSLVSFLLALHTDGRLVRGFARKSSRIVLVRTLQSQRSLGALVSNALRHAFDTVSLYVHLAWRFSSQRQDVSRAYNWHIFECREDTMWVSGWGDSSTSTRVTPRGFDRRIHPRLHLPSLPTCDPGEGGTKTPYNRFHHAVQHILPRSGKFRR